MSTAKANAIRNSIYGLAIGDAFGVPVEFTSREERERNPVADFIGYGSHDVPAGTWSDDTSMTLATLDSLAVGDPDYDDMMERFLKWLDEGEYTATGVVFDVGMSTQAALANYAAGDAWHESGMRGEYDNGNGSLMRILPAVYYAELSGRCGTDDEKLELIHNVSSLTHAHPRSLMGCGIYAFIVMELLRSPDKSAVQKGIARARAFYASKDDFSGELAVYRRILDEEMDAFARIPEDEIRSGGYVVDTLEAAVWCFLNTDSFYDCIVRAANLGSDTDTVAAVAGGLAGLVYDDLSFLKEKLVSRDYLEAICEKFIATLPNKMMIPLGLEANNE